MPEPEYKQATDQQNQQAEQSHQAQQSQQAEQSQQAQQAIIDTFLAKAPTLGPIRLAETDGPQPGQKAELYHHQEDQYPTADTDSLSETERETLAKALLSVGKRKQAAAILLRLACEIPQKSVYFANLLDGGSGSGSEF